MALESVSHIDDLVTTNPVAGDPRSEGDDHLRNIKVALKADFPNITGAMNATQAELNHVVGVTGAIQTALDAKALLAGGAGQDFAIKILTMANLLKTKAGANIASATTLVINTATGNVILVTGTTATTAVTMDAGQIMIAIADGAWPLTHHATNLKLNLGGASYTCEAGDIVLFCKSLANVVYGIVIPVDGKELVTTAITSADMPAGTQVQKVHTQTGTVNTGTTQFPTGDVIPDNADGDEYMTLAITPNHVDNRLEIKVSIECAHSTTSEWLAMGLFQDATVNAIAAAIQFEQSAQGTIIMTLTHEMAAGTTSPTTFKVRAGGHSGSGTFTFNGTNSGGQFGGALRSFIQITETKV